MFDRLATAFALRRLHWSDIPCPLCGKHDGDVLIARDRYLVKVNLRQCNQCGLIYTGRNLAGEDLAQFYQETYSDVYEYGKDFAPGNIYKTLGKLKAAYRFSEAQKVVGNISGVVEVGAGLGFFLRECADHGVSDLIGFEPSETLSRYACERLGLNGRIINAMYTAYDASFPRANLFALFHVLEHLEDPTHLLSWIEARIGDGWLVIEVPDIARGWESLGRFNFHFGHRFYFTIGTLELFLRNAGLGIVAHVTELDDGIYPGNLRIFARRLDLAGVDFVNITPQQREETREKVLRHGRAMGLRNGALLSALRLMKP